MAIIWVLPHSFDDVVRTISVLDNFDKQSVIQLLKDVFERALQWQSTKGTASGGMRLYSMRGNQATHLQVGEWD